MLVAVTKSARKGGGPPGPRVSALDREAEEVLSGDLKITQRAMVQRRRSYASI